MTTISGSGFLVSCTWNKATISLLLAVRGYFTLYFIALLHRLEAKNVLW